MQRITPWACLKFYGLLQLACMAWLLATHWQAIANPTLQPAQPGGRRAALTAPATTPLTTPAPASAAIPRDALRHQLTLKREAMQAWGLGAPVATFAAQVHQESRWRADATSPVGAQGMAQFMPATARWISGIDGQLATGDTRNPTWALRALVVYDKWLWDRIKAVDDCNRMAMTLSAYNGGLGWVYRDQALASGKGLDRQVWWQSVETVNAGRSQAAWTENRHYPRAIIHQHQPLYARWGAGVCT